MDRRKFLRTGLTLPAISFAGGLPLVFAEGAARGNRDDDRVLVVVQLTGGNDGLNTVIPVDQDTYHRHRPTLRIARNDAVPFGHDALVLHPSLKGIAELLKEGAASIIQGVGYANPNRSHFESMDLWHTAHGVGPLRQTGWLGRLPSTAASGSQLMHVGSEAMPRALWTQGDPALSIRSLESMRLPEVRKHGHAMKDLIQLAASQDVAGGVTTKLAGQLRAAVDVSTAIEQASVASGARGEYPGGKLSDCLHAVGRLVATGFSARVYYVTLDGFDTHASQGNSHASLLDQLSRSLHAFVDDLRGNGQWERTQILVFSEFGRRLQENAGRGTDHGAAGPVFLLGGPQRESVIGKHPNLDALDEAGDPRYLIDYRRVYATLLEDWFGVDSQAILGDRYEKIA